MTTIKRGDFTGFSNLNFKEAVQNALQNAGEYTHFEIIETLGSKISESQSSYQVTLAIFSK